MVKETELYLAVLKLVADEGFLLQYDIEPEDLIVRHLGGELFVVSIRGDLDPREAWLESQSLNINDLVLNVEGDYEFPVGQVVHQAGSSLVRWIPLTRAGHGIVGVAISDTTRLLSKELC